MFDLRDISPQISTAEKHKPVHYPLDVSPSAILRSVPRIPSQRLSQDVSRG